MQCDDQILEGILFAMGEPVPLTSLAFALSCDLKEAKCRVDEFMQRYNAKQGGMQVIELDDAYQMTTRPEIFSSLIRVVKQPKRFTLTRATLETLAIIAYRQPVTKHDIEQIRGVNSDYVVARLVEYGMIEEVGRAETIGRPLLFATTTAFLRQFGMKDLKDFQSHFPVFVEPIAMAEEKMTRDETEGGE